MSKIWSVIIIISVIFFIFTGNVKEANNVILQTSYDTLKTFGFLASNIILWSGILEVAIDSGTIKYMSFLVKPLIKKIFTTKDEMALDYISANITCNIFALGSAATPFAIKAMERLKLENNGKNEESKDMSTLIIINICGFTIIPTTLISLRTNYNSNLNGFVLLYILFFSFVTTLIMLFLNKVFN